MSEIMRLIPFEKIMDWMSAELAQKGSIFGVRKEKFYKNKSGTYIDMFGDKISSPVGPAAGPNSQLAQNIIASYLGGSRFIELKTVQIMDGEELSKCVPRPCINASDECYNVEWSTELTVPDAMNEYIKAYFAMHVIAKELEISDSRDFAFNMSVGYDLKGIQSEKIDKYIEGLKDASNTEIWKECVAVLKSKMGSFKRFTEADLNKIDTKVCNSITLSTLHGCPPDEIERISKYLLDVKGVHTYIKCNPTLLGYETARNLLDELGYDYIGFDDHHFKDDLQFTDAVPMLERLTALAKSKGLDFGVKITNTFPVEINNKELPGEEMYMSGRSLFPLSLTVAARLSKAFNGTLPISYSGGADAFTIKQLFDLGIQPITVATTILKPGGYERLKQLAEIVEPSLNGKFAGIDVAKICAAADNVTKNAYINKEARAYGSRKTDSDLPLYDCYKAPCREGGCPIEQQIPRYLQLVSDKNYKDAFDVISVDNACPAITGTICNHPCQSKCTRLDYDESLQIREMKKIAVLNAQDDFVKKIVQHPLKTDKRVVVIGAGPAGIAAALFLRRNGVAVTVLEKLSKPYGIISHVIPSFRISDEMIERDYQLAVKAGVEFKYNQPANFDVQVLKKEYDYVVIATGAWKEGACPVKEGGDKLIDALDFLKKSRENNCKVDLGKRVAVIGGGDVAMDCARAAKKASGVNEVVIVYRRTKGFMPAEREEIRDALKDGAQLMELTAPVRFDGKTLHCEKMRLGEKDESGRRGVIGTGELVDLEFDTVIAAVGARVDTTPFEKNGVKMDAKGRMQLDAHNQSSVEKVYVAGDCKAGPSTVVKAIADAKAIAKHIMSELKIADDFKREKADVAIQKLYDRKGILEMSTKSEAEGERCLSCSQLCEICCDVCPNRANVYVNVAEGVFDRNKQIVHLDGMCNECGNCGIFCPHTGNPYKDKVTVFWTEHDFIDSTNKGFLNLGENKFKVRKEDGSIIEHVRGDGKISKEMAAIMDAVINQYPYYLSI